MEAFEQFVAVALETEGFVVGPAVKFHLRRRTKKQGREEHQTHGYEVDLVAARADKLVLASVKSFFGSRGVQACEVTGAGGKTGLYRLLNDVELREEVVAAAAERYGYRADQVVVRLYAGKFAGKNGADQAAIRTWCADQVAGGGPIEVVALDDVVKRALTAARSGTYVDNAVVVSMKVLAAAGVLDTGS